MSWIPSCKLRFLRSLQDRTFVLHIYTAPTGESVTKVHNHRDKSVKKILVFQSTRGVAHLPSCCTTANTQKQLCFSSGSLCVGNKSQAIISLLSSRRFAALTDLGRCCPSCNSRSFSGERSWLPLELLASLLSTAVATGLLRILRCTAPFKQFVTSMLKRVVKQALSWEEGASTVFDCAAIRLDLTGLYLTDRQLPKWSSTTECTGAAKRSDLHTETQSVPL